MACDKGQTTCYNPTSTTLYARCPRLFHLQSRWESRGPWHAARAMGSAVAVAQRVYYQGGPWDEACQRAQEALGEAYRDNTTWDLGVLAKILQKALSVSYAVSQAIVAAEEVLFVEERLGESQPDLVTRHKVTGDIAVTDGKVAFDQGARYRTARLAQYETLGQLFQYAWRVGKLVGPVTRLRVHLTYCLPKAESFLHPVTISPKRIEDWLAHAAPTWERMTQSLRQGVYPPNWTACWQYGQCEYYEACHTYHGDESLFGVLYQRSVEPRHLYAATPEGEPVVIPKD